MLEQTLQIIASSTLSAAIIVFLARSLMQLWISKELEAHKIRLEGESVREAERLRADLARSTTEHTIRFTRLHEQRARIISGIYSRLDRLNRSLATLLGWARFFPDPERAQEAREAAITALREFTDYYYPRSIWLDTETCAQLNRIVRHLQDAAIPLLLAQQNPSTVTPNQIEEAAQLIEGDVPLALGLLTKQFREILGVERHGENDQQQVVSAPAGA